MSDFILVLIAIFIVFGVFRRYLFFLVMNAVSKKLYKEMQKQQGHSYAHQRNQEGKLLCFFLPSSQTESHMLDKIKVSEVSFNNHNASRSLVTTMMLQATDRWESPSWRLRMGQVLRRRNKTFISRDAPLRISGLTSQRYCCRWRRQRIQRTLTNRKTSRPTSFRQWMRRFTTQLTAKSRYSSLTAPLT